MPRPKKTQDETQEESKDVQQVLLKNYLEEKKADHFNNIVPASYKTSTGSLKLDLELGGGIPNSIIRCAGMAEAGKTSFSLNVCKNFLKEPNRRAIYFLSDKDLSENIIKRCGVKFVENIDDWVDGTCYIIRTNVYEMVCNTIKKLVKSRSTEKQYMFILDSMDNFAPKSALEIEDFGESRQKGGTGAITSHFFQCFNILLPRLGHSIIMISQFRDTIVIGQQKQPTYKQMNTSGGRSQEHAASWAFEFSPAMNAETDMFWEGEKYKSKKLGHNCIIRLKKTTNEKTGNTVKYPIIYGRENGNSIWLEKELYEMLLLTNKLKAAGSWLSFEPTTYQELKAIDDTIPEKIQGENQMVNLLMSKPTICEFLYKKFLLIFT